MRLKISLCLTVLLLVLFSHQARAQDRMVDVVSLEFQSRLALEGKARVIIALREPLPDSLTERKRQIAAAQARVLSSLLPSDFELKYRYEAVSALVGELSAEGLAKLANHGEVLQISPDEEFSLQLAQSVPLIRADAVHALGYTGEGVVVAVLDSGIAPDHPDLREALIDEHCFCSSGSGCCDNGQAEQGGPGAAQDRTWHGTNVTGVIASRGHVAPAGVAPGSSIVAIKVHADGFPLSGGPFSDVIMGLDWLLNHRPDVQVINMSLGGGLFSEYCDDTSATARALAQAINLLRARGVATFVASANNGSLSGLSLPACLRNAISVAAVYDDDIGSFTWPLPPVCTDATTRANQMTCFSNRNALLKLVAPGCLIRSSGLDGGISFACGTSQAAPHAAGVAALMLSANPELTVDEIETILRNTGVPVVDERTGLRFPRIDALAAIKAVISDNE